jgi:hypothetical protein
MKLSNTALSQQSPSRLILPAIPLALSDLRKARLAYCTTRAQLWISCPFGGQRRHNAIYSASQTKALLEPWSGRWLRNHIVCMEAHPTY